MPIVFHRMVISTNMPQTKKRIRLNCFDMANALHKIKNSLGCIIKQMK